MSKLLGLRGADTGFVGYDCKWTFGNETEGEMDVAREGFFSGGGR